MARSIRGIRRAVTNPAPRIGGAVRGKGARADTGAPRRKRKPTGGRVREMFSRGKGRGTLSSAPGTGFARKAGQLSVGGGYGE